MKRFLLVLLLAAFAVFAWFFVREYQRVTGQPLTSWTQDHTADCALVLTGGQGRVREGFDLLNRKVVKKLIISGVHPQAKLHEIFPQAVFYSGVLEQDVVLEKRSTTTYGNAQQSLPLIEALHCRDVILITSQLHMYRSLRTIQAVFPANLSIYPHSILSGSYRPALAEASQEVFKSLFYSIWAY
jgi:uncharacterized SAM-binding protein YcdF (DUF218 family)